MHQARRTGVALALALLSAPALAPAQPASAVAPASLEPSTPGSASAERPASPEPPPPGSASAERPESPEPPSLGSASAERPAPWREPGAPVFLARTQVLVLRVARNGQSAEQRAGTATAALRRVLDDGGAAEVHVDTQGDVAVVLVGARPIVELGPEDAATAGDPTLQAHAGRIAAQIRDALRKEQSRSATLVTLLSIALVVLSGLMGLFLARRAVLLADQTRAWIAQHPDRIPAIRLRSIEVIHPASLGAAIHIGVGAAKALAQIGLGYGWVLITLSLFDATRGYAEQLTSFVFGPLYALIVRLVSSLPLLVVTAIAGIALIVLVRFVGLFFDSVARGETTVEWLPADLAPPTSVLVRLATILVFLIIAAPLVTGDDGGTLTRVGTVAVVTLGLAITPLLASVAVGATVVYGRQLRVDDFAEIGGRAGRVRAITLLEVRIEDDRGFEVRVPHLLRLVHPTCVLGPAPLVSVVVTLAPSTVGQEHVRELLLAAAARVGERPEADLLSLDADGARYGVSAYSSAPRAKARLSALVAEALTAADVPLGRPPRAQAS